MPTRMMRRLPSWGNDRALTNLHNAIAWTEARGGSCVEQFDMRPLKTMPMHIIGNLAEQYAIRL